MTQAPVSLSGIYCVLEGASVVHGLQSSEDRGLGDNEATQRLLEMGHNAIPTKAPDSFLSKVWDQINNPLILLLLGSACLSLLLGHVDDAVSIALAVLIVSTVAFIQEYKTEQSLKALENLSPFYARAQRSGRHISLQATDLVPGDMIYFEAGDRIPADARILEANGLSLDESSLTGENQKVYKTPDAIEAHPSLDLDSFGPSWYMSPEQLLNLVHVPRIPLAERKNIAYMGTLVSSGNGRAVVIATGPHSELGKICGLMKDIENPRTPLQESMDQLGQQLAYISIAIIILISLAGVLQGRRIFDMFTIGVSLAVAAIPEGLPIVVTVTLALGVLRMAKQNAIVKRLPSVETLSSVSVLCIDKTGTITTNKMTLTKLYTPSSSFIQASALSRTEMVTLSMDAVIEKLLKTINICNNARIEPSGEAKGQPTEVALLDFCVKIGMLDERRYFARTMEEPFDPATKYMMVQGHFHDNRPIYFAKGALTSIMSLCTHYLSHSGPVPLDEHSIQMIERANDTMSSEGLRVLACALGEHATGLTFAGLAAMHDVPRIGIDDCIGTLIGMGVQIVMITGDSEGTAKAIAKQVGIPVAESMKSSISGYEMDHMSKAQLELIAGSVNVYYRTSPRHKMDIIAAFQAQGKVVAMTGDGVNDAPALRLADVGISMGKSGTDVAKEAADMILVDDDFRTVLLAIEEGKSIYCNIRNFLRFQLSTSMSALLLITISTLLGLPNPLNAMQILWINIICDGPVAQSLGIEAVDPEVTRQPPRSKKEPIITAKLISRILTSATCVLVVVLWIYSRHVVNGEVSIRGRTMTFTAFVVVDMWNSLGCRSESRSVFKLPKNIFYNYAVAFCLLGQLLVIYTPFLQSVFQTQALSVFDLLYISILGSIVWIADEVSKAVDTVFVFKRSRYLPVQDQLGRV